MSRHSQSNSTLAAATHVHAVPDSNSPVVTGPLHEALAERANDISVKTGIKQGQCGQNWRQTDQSESDASRVALQEWQDCAMHEPTGR